MNTSLEGRAAEKRKTDDAALGNAAGLVEGRGFKDRHLAEDEIEDGSEYNHDEGAWSLEKNVCRNSA